LLSSNELTQVNEFSLFNFFFVIKKKSIYFIILFFFCRDEINKAYRKLAVLLHPDKSVAPGSEEAFKVLVAARTALLKRCS
jgi:hypothetical protein